MSDPNNTHARQIIERIVITGDLTLITPTSLGNGDADGLLDMPLSRDAAEGQPLLTGSSIAGALRNYLRLRYKGYRVGEQGNNSIENLFGCQRSNDAGTQSPLIVDDAWAAQVASEIRDNVRIDPQTRTAQDEKKFDLELLPAGTTFGLHIELLIMEGTDRATLLTTLALALSGFEKQEIYLGARKRRGFGQCVVKEWTVQTYDLKQSQGLLAWLAANLQDMGQEWGLQPTQTKTHTIATTLGVTLPDTDARHYFTCTAHFALASPLLIRSEEPRPLEKEVHPDKDTSNNDTPLQYPDVTHLWATHNDTQQSQQSPLLPGTSLAGALRAQAQRILNTLTGQKQNQDRVQEMLDSIFGSDMDKRPTKKYASRLVVNESTIDAQPEHWLVQQRVSIDRFTGGAYDTALFSEAPLTGGTVEITMTLQGTPTESSRNYTADVGLLLLLLKDLWTGDLTLGGTRSIGHGRLRGISATLRDTHNEQREWKLEAENNRNTIHIREGNGAELEAYVTALRTALGVPEEATR